MRKLATIAFLAASLFTAACTETEDDLDTVASIDDISDLAMDEDSDSVSARQLGDGAEVPGSSLNPTAARPAHAPIADSAGDRIDPTPAGGRHIGPYLECRTQTKLDSDEPVIDRTSDEIGRTARSRWEMLRKAKLNRFQTSGSR
jgi:hypothetical protein